MQNTSSNDASNVVVSNALPAVIMFQSASAQCSHTAGTVDCTVGDLAAGDSIILSVVAQAAAVGSLSNTASVSSAEADTDLGNNQQSLALSVSDSDGTNNNGTDSDSDNNNGGGGGGSTMSLLFLMLLMLVLGYERYSAKAGFGSSVPGQKQS